MIHIELVLLLVRFWGEAQNFSDEGPQKILRKLQVHPYLYAARVLHHLDHARLIGSPICMI